VSALRLLGLEPKDRAAARAWIEEAASDDYVSYPRTLFHLCSAGALLGVPEKWRRLWAERVRRFENPFGGFGAWKHFDPEVTSELETTYYAIEVLTMAGLDLDVQRIAEFVRQLQNPDGGFGRAGCSTLSSTYLAVAILNRLSVTPETLVRARDWLSSRNESAALPYIEDIYWYVDALRLLGERPQDVERVMCFVLACQHPSGGFSRATFGIATLECTHYALQILRLADAV
jgi:hypothetical protein